jgi:hypothetical protein
MKKFPFVFKYFIVFVVSGSAILFIHSCSDDDNTEVETDELPAMYSLFTEDVTISKDGDFVVIKSNGVPNHKSPYFNSNDSRYEAYNGSNSQYNQNPNSIDEQNLTFRVPCAPEVNSTHEATSLGPIGVALNGVPLYNQYAGPNQPLTNEINSFDQYNGHPQQQSQYHYHIEPLYLTSTNGKSGLLGVLLDGFPVYGPMENGKTLTSSDLDAYHGHFGTTNEFPNGIYHYHFTGDAPYMNGDGYYGTKGSVTQ